MISRYLVSLAALLSRELSGFPEPRRIFGIRSIACRGSVPLRGGRPRWGWGEPR